MSEDYPASCSGGSSSDDDDGGYDGLMDDKEEKELMVECGQRQVRAGGRAGCGWLWACRVVCVGVCTAGSGRVGI
jgi:hypothetical protein